MNVQIQAIHYRIILVALHEIKSISKVGGLEGTEDLLAKNRAHHCHLTINQFTNINRHF